MPTRGSTQINTFVKGLLTEASPLAFPPNTALDILNFRLNKDGSIHRRLGIDVEEGGAFYNFNISAEVLATSRKSFYRWQNPNGNPNVDIGVVQLGSFFWFINLFAPAPSIALLNSGNPIDAGVDHRTRFSMATINGYLAVVSAALDTPFLVTYNEATDSITYETADIMVRDIWGVDDFMTEYHRPSDLNDEHRYNLRNQGWSPNIITTCGPGIDAVSCTFLTHNIFPSNSDHWSIGRIEDLTSADVYKYDPNIAARNIVEQGQTAKGSMIINLYNRGSSRMALTGINLPLDRDRGRVSTIASYAGRIFYSGIYSDQIGTDARSPKLSNIVLFSQLFINKIDLVKCYQQADPTSIDFSDIVDTDGGLIQIPECGQVTRLMTVKDSLFVFATNGIWRIRGDEGGFRATSFQVDKISNVFCSSPDSIIELNGTIFLWGIDGIYSLVPNDTGMYNTISLTIPTIQTLYNSLPDISKLQAKGFYDLSQNRLRWLYYSDESKISGDPIDTPREQPDIVELGTTTSITTTSAFRLDVVRMTDDLAMVTYTTSTGGLRITLLTITGVNISTGSEQNPVVSNVNSITSVCRLNNTQALITYLSTGSNIGCRVLTISGTSVSAGTETTFPCLAGATPKVESVSSTQCIVVYRNAAGNVASRSLSVSGTTITANAECVVSINTTVNYQNLDIVNSSHAIASYLDTTGSAIKCRVITISGTTLAVPGLEYNVASSAATTAQITEVKMKDSTTGIVTWVDAGAVIKSNIITVSGTTIIASTAHNYSRPGSTFSGQFLPNGKYVMGYNETTNNFPNMLVSTITSIVIEGLNEQLNNETSFEFSVDNLTSNKVIIVYKAFSSANLKGYVASL